jgi:hypothetical protein
MLLGADVLDVQREFVHNGIDLFCDARVDLGWHPLLLELGEYISSAYPWNSRTRLYGLL